MARSSVLVVLLVTTLMMPASAHPQDASTLGGVWTLNRTASELTRDIGFTPSWVNAAAAAEGRGDTGSTGRGRGGRGSGGGDRQSASPFSGRTESYEDARRIQFMNGEARNPPARLTIVDTPSAVTFTNELGQSRTVHPTGKQESLEIQGSLLPVTSSRDGDRLVVIYHAGPSREVRYTYSRAPDSPRLVVDLQFLDHGAGDKARHVYDPGLAGTATPSTAPADAPAPGRAAGQPAPEPFDQRPGAELKGLTSVGILVEELSAQAVACGLNRQTIEGALSKKLTDGGFTVRRNSDEDTYVYVNIMTSSAANGLCVSRYDAFLYTHATAKLPYRDQPVLVQVSLMHRGGMGSSAPSAHGAAVARGLEGYIDLFVTQIHDANK